MAVAGPVDERQRAAYQSVEKVLFLTFLTGRICWIAHRAKAERA
jgi:hypothetical protein